VVIYAVVFFLPVFFQKGVLGYQAEFVYRVGVKIAGK
jgi:hypothetical protein